MALAAEEERVGEGREARSAWNRRMVREGGLGRGEGRGEGKEREMEWYRRGGKQPGQEGGSRGRACAEERDRKSVV